MPLRSCAGGGSHESEIVLEFIATPSGLSGGLVGAIIKGK